LKEKNCDRRIYVHMKSAVDMHHLSYNDVLSLISSTI